MTTIVRTRDNQADGSPPVAHTVKLTASTVDILDACRLRYQRTVLLRDAKTERSSNEPPQGASNPLRRSMSAHRALAVFNRTLMTEGRRPDVDRLIQSLWPPRRTATSETEETVTFVQACLHAYDEYLALSDLRPIAAEHVIVTPQRRILGHGDVTVALTGRIDVVHRVSSGASNAQDNPDRARKAGLVACDFKCSHNGGSLPLAQEMAELASSTVTHLLLDYFYPEASSIEIMRLLLPGGHFVRIQLSSDMLNSGRECLRQLALDVARGDDTPHVSEACGTCAYLTWCPAHYRPDADGQF